MDEPRKFPILDSLHLPGFTPVRRPHIGILCDTPAGPHDVAWTSTRCNRLLRPISSRIAQLRKQRIIKEAPVPLIPSVTESKQFLPSANVDDDLDWNPDDRPNKKPRRTYSSKNSSLQVPKKSSSNFLDDLLINASLSATSQALVGDDLMDHQARTGELGTFEESREDRLKRRQYRKKALEPRHRFRQLAKTVTPVDWMLYDGLYSSLDHLLKFTAKIRPRPLHGTSSLFSTCLKTIPRLIAEEQKHEDQKELEVDGDVSKSIYEDLEAYGTVSDAGWKPLREVVRAHGIALVGDAIENGLITPSIARGLVILCLQSSAFEEAEVLCSSLLRTLSPIGKPWSSCSRLFVPETAVALQTLRDMTTQSRRWSFFFRSLTVLVDTDIVPVEWMAREEMVECWNEAFLSSADGCGVSTSAMSLVEKVIALAYRDPKLDTETLIHEFRLRSCVDRKDLSNKSIYQVAKARVVMPLLRRQSVPDNVVDSTTTIVSNLISILLAVNCSRDDGSAPPVFWMDILRTVFIDFAVQQELHVMSRDPKFIATNVEVPAVISFAFVLLPSIVHDSNSISNMPEIATKHMLADPDSPSACEALSMLLRAIATCWSRLCCTEPFDHLQQLVDHCLSLASNSGAQISSKLLCKISTTAAIEFAECGNDIKHLDWALEVEERADEIENRDARRDGPSNTRVANEIKYRWDDNICEWIAKTPTLPKKKTCTILQSNSYDILPIPTPKASQHSRELVPCVPVWSSFFRSSPEPDPSESSEPSFTMLENDIDYIYADGVDFRYKPCKGSYSSNRSYLKRARGDYQATPAESGVNALARSRTAVVQIPIHGHTSNSSAASKEEYSEDDELCHNNNAHGPTKTQLERRASALRNGTSNALHGSRRIGRIKETTKNLRSRTNASLTTRSARAESARPKIPHASRDEFSEDELGF